MSITTSDFLRHLRTLAERQAIGGLSDQQLLERFRLERSEASFAELVQRHGPMVLRVCRRVLQHAQDAEDAFQATFLVLARKAALLRQPPLLSGWLHGVAHHVALRLKAKAERRTAHEHRIDPPPLGDVLDDISWRELRVVLDEELQRLPEKHRAPLVLCYLEGRTQDEAARQLGWSKTTFRRRLESGRNALGRRLTRRGVTLPTALSAPLLADATAQAALPPLLAANTVRAGLAAATGQATDALVSAQVAALVEGGTYTLLAKKVSVAVVLLASLTLGLGGFLAHRAVHSRTLAEAPAAPKPAPSAPRSSPARSASKEQAIEIKGRVLDPDGKPLAGARLFLLSDGIVKKADISVRATTDKDGLFRFPAKATDFDPQGKATLAAAVKGLGPDWIKMSAENKDAITLRLVKDDVPIEGRVLDLEGRPVADVRVRVTQIMQGNVDAWLEAMRRARVGVANSPQLDKHISPEALGEAAAAVTGKDGRFRLTGFGRDRILHVLLEGAMIERGDFMVVARPELPRGWGKGSNVYPACFDHLAGPGKSITGTVRDKRTGKPIAGISVSTGTGFSFSGIEATTDDQGRYRLTGVPKRKQYRVYAQGVPYFECPKDAVPDTPGLEPVTVDIALERGIAVHGKLLDKVTGKPIRGEVQCFALPNNPNLKDITNPRALGPFPRQTKADGSFMVVAVPGPGLLVAQANDSGRYLTAVVSKPRPAVRGYLEGKHAIVRVDLSEKEPQSTTQNLYLEPAQTVNGTVVGPNDKPLAGAHCAGLSGTLEVHFRLPPKMETASFTAGGISPKRRRNIVFVHAEKKLAKIQPIGGDTANPLTVRLGPLGAIRGRILDAAGRPRAGIKMMVRFSNQKSDYQDLPLELLYNPAPWRKILDCKATTDAEGRFRVEGLVPGLKYFLVEVPGKFLDPTVRSPFPPLARGIAVESGKTKDLGDLKSKPAPEK